MKRISHAAIAPWLTLVARLLLGGVLLVAGYLKTTNPAQAAASVRVYRVLPTGLANVFGYALPWIEIGIALLLILGIWVRYSAVAGGGLMLLFIIAIGQAWARKLAINCGCFGNGGVSADGKVHPGVYLAEMLRDLGLVLVAAYLYRFPRGKCAIDRIPEEFTEG